MKTSDKGIEFIIKEDGEPKVGLTKEEFKNLAISKLQHSFIK